MNTDDDEIDSEIVKFWKFRSFWVTSFGNWYETLRSGCGSLAWSTAVLLKSLSSNLYYLTWCPLPLCPFAGLSCVRHANRMTFYDRQLQHRLLFLWPVTFAGINDRRVYGIAYFVCVSRIYCCCLPARYKKGIPGAASTLWGRELAAWFGTVSQGFSS